MINAKDVGGDLCASQSAQGTTTGTGEPNKACVQDEDEAAS